MEINKEENCVSVNINPKIYPLDVIYNAAYVFIDKAYVLIDGDPNEGVLVELKPKKEFSLEVLGREFNNELLNYSVYKTQSDKTKDIRTAIIQRALITNDPSVIGGCQKKDSEEYDYLEDPEGIAIPWEEKYCKDKKSKKRAE